MSIASGLLIVNGVPRGGDGDSTAISVSSFLESTPGVYTTTRTHGGASVVLFWDRHMRRLAESARLLAEAPSGGTPAPLGRAAPPYAALRPLVDRSLHVGLGLAAGRRKEGEELAVTALVAAGGGDVGDVDVCVHVGAYAPPLFGVAARLAVVGRGRDLARAKYSEWARIRKTMEKLRPPSVTELLLSNDGDQILEGSSTNFFVICRKPPKNPRSASLLEIQTAPVSGGVLPGVLRQLVIEVCFELGIPVKEVAPSWSGREFWEESFVTNSLRIIQHVEMIQAPYSWGDVQSESWEDIQWVEKHFEGPGDLTIKIQKRLQERTITDGFAVSCLI